MMMRSDQEKLSHMCHSSLTEMTQLNLKMIIEALKLACGRMRKVGIIQVFQKRPLYQNQQSKSMKGLNKVQLSQLSKLPPKKLRKQVVRMFLGSLKKLQKKRVRKNHKHPLKRRNKIKRLPNNLKHKNKRKKIGPN